MYKIILYSPIECQNKTDVCNAYCHIKFHDYCLSILHKLDALFKRIFLCYKKYIVRQEILTKENIVKVDKSA